MSKDRIQLSDHFTTGRLLRFVASPIIMMIFTSVYSVVDGFFVSNFAGKTAFSALNLIYPFLQAFGCLGFMVGTGGSALVAMTLGTGDKKQADNLFSMLAASTIVMGIVSTIIGWFLLEPAAQLLGATPELLPNCLTYGRILLVFQTAFMMQFFFQSFFITSEKPKLGLAFTVLAGLTNIVLDFLLVGVLRGGIVGAASATVISQMVGGIGPMFYFFNRKNSSLLHFVRPKFSAKALGKACANGSSELMTNLSASLVSALYNLQLMRLIGADGVAAYGVLMYVGCIFAAVFIGYAQGCAPIIRYHDGAENHDCRCGDVCQCPADGHAFGEDVRRLRHRPDGADRACAEAVRVLLPAVRLQHFLLGVLYGVEQRCHLGGDLLPAHAGVSGVCGAGAAHGAGH